MRKEPVNDESKKLAIKVKEVKPRTEKSRLPARLSQSYPVKLLTVFVHPQVLHSLRLFAASEPDHELGGVLIGKVGKASRRSFVEILDFVPASKGVSRRASFEFTNEAQKEIHAVMEDRFKGLRILGWFHTHPGYGVFLSSADEFIDEHYFKESYHVAIVIDPTQEDADIGTFVWNRDQQRIRVPLFEITTETQRHGD
jgi:proteasome lid subunit RPN8/RPN11